MLIYRDNQLFKRYLEFFGGALHDANIGLVRDQPVDIGIRQMGFGERCTRCAFKHAHCQFKDSLAIHLEQRIAQHFATRYMTGYAQNTHMFAIGMQIAGQNAWRFRRLQHNCSCAITKQDAGGSV